MSVLSVTVLGMAEAIVASIVLLCSCRILGYAFSIEKEVVDYLRDMTPLLCLLIATDCIQAVLSGEFQFLLVTLYLRHLAHNVQFH